MISVRCKPKKAIYGHVLVLSVIVIRSLLLGRGADMINYIRCVRDLRL